MSLAIPWSELAPFLLIGFTAQLVDSAFGMAFGLVSNALLTFLGFPPAVASATTRTAESFASGVSGLSHALQRNVDWPLFARLALPGILGGLVGVWFLSVVDVQITRPVMLVYMAAIGVYLIWRAPRRPQTFRRMRFVGPLGAAGGFLDAAAGGGWGPVVTGNLLAQGMTPRMAIGTVNAAEFFVTVTVLSAFIGTLGISAFTIAATGLLIGALRGTGAAIHSAWAKREIARLFPQLGRMAFAHQWYGMIGMTGNALPRLHRIDRNIVSISAYNGRGIAPGTSFGRDLAHLALGEAVPEDLALPLTEIGRAPLRAIRTAYYEAGAQALHLVGTRFQPKDPSA